MSRLNRFLAFDSLIYKGTTFMASHIKKLTEKTISSLVLILTLMWIPRLMLILIRTLILKQYPASGVSLATSANFKYKF